MVKALFLLGLFVILHLGACSQSPLPKCAEVRIHTGVPTLFVNGEPYPPYAYMSYLGTEKYYREAANAGIHLYNFPAYLGDRGINSSSGIGTFRSPIWTGENEYDYSGIIQDFEQILRADREAKVIIRIHLDPPEWWEQKNPGEVCELPDGSSLRTSFSSLRWKEESGEVLRLCVKWLLESDYADHLIGIHVAGGYTEEWFYHFKDFFYDENPLRLMAFQKWLREHYHDNEATLQEAWNNPDLNFENAQLADISGKEKKEAWRDPCVELNVIDSYRFHAENMADHIAYFCKIVKEVSQGCLLTGAFYGYHYFVSDPRRGNGALGKLLDCPDLDYLSSPNDYKRVLGEDWAPMAAMESIRLHGKLWLAENDTRTSITTLLKDQAPEICPPGKYETGVWLGPQDMKTSVSLLWKNAGRMLANGYGGWWFDMWGGWFSDPELMEVIERTQRYHLEYPFTEEDKTQAQVGVIVDEQLAFWDASLGNLTGKILGNRYALGKTSAPYDLYLRSDFNAIATSSYKLVWLMGFLDLNVEERQRLEEMRQQGITVLWTDGSGTGLYKRGKEVVLFEDQLQWSASQLRKLWKEAGVHIYLDTDDVVYVGRNWLCVHTVKGGERIVKLPFYARITNPMNACVVSDSTKTIELDLLPKSTSLLRVSPL